MTNDLMPASLQDQVRAALTTLGYSEISEGYDFQLSRTRRQKEAPLPLAVAFWQDARDQFGSAIAVRWVSSEHTQIESYLKAIANDLWAPYSIVAEPRGCEIWETIGPLSTLEQTFRRLARVPYGALPLALAHRSSELGPNAVARQKRVWRQKALYEASPEPNAFLQWAYRPTRDRLANVLSTLVRDVYSRSALDSLFTERVRWLIRLLGVRITWDKRWMESGDRASARELLAAARFYPTRLSQNETLHADVGLEVARQVVQHLAHVHLAAANGGLLSQLMQDNGVPTELLRHWRLFLTPPDVAWQLLADLPIESLATSERFLWDSTCGSGTLLVAGLERLRSLSSLTGRDLREYLVEHVRGNERQPAMAELTRIRLDLALERRQVRTGQLPLATPARLSASRQTPKA